MVLSFLVATASAAMVDREPNGCTIDTAQVLALPEADFDQGEKGWRILARPGCFLAAVDVIASYRTAHPGHGHMLYFHEAQMRAAGNDYEGAAPLFDMSRSWTNEWNVDTGWNHYVAASAAFVRRDLAALKAHRERLAHLPPPPLQPQVAEAARRDPVPEGWPFNLDVVDALVRCFDRPYADAMTSCRT